MLSLYIAYLNFQCVFNLFSDLSSCSENKFEVILKKLVSILVINKENLLENNLENDHILTTLLLNTNSQSLAKHAGFEISFEVYQNRINTKMQFQILQEDLHLNKQKLASMAFI